MILKCDKFLPISSLSDVRFTQWLDQVKQMDWSDYELWVYGGILDKPITRDIDASLIGPWAPDRIRLLLDGMYQIAFELQIEPDIKYQTIEQLTQPDSPLLSGYPPGMLLVGNKKLLCGKLGDGNLRWKQSKFIPRSYWTKTRKQLI
tara:strand:+ start:770 stop:1210 length:441 start_codon:yes stop_codon:yes gene_type:complete